MLAGLSVPQDGTVHVNARFLMIDQQFSLLDPARSALANLASLAPGRREEAYRTFLAGIGLAGERVHLRASQLSGGERVRLALLALDATPEPYDLLLLDEPDNHLDLEAKLLLEQALHDYPGALLLVSHDPVFVEHVGIAEVLCLDDSDP